MLISRYIVNLEDEAVRVALDLGNGREPGENWDSHTRSVELEQFSGLEILVAMTFDGFSD